MIKKSISVTTALLTALTALLPLYSSAESISSLPVQNEKKASFRNNYSLSAPSFRRSVLEGDNSPIQIPTMGSIKNLFDVTYGEMPSSFDLRNYGEVSDVRNQAGYGTCWAHSAIASAETSVIISNPSVDLSEFHTAYYTYSGGEQIEPQSDNLKDTMNRGGTCYLVTNLWSQWIGPVFEKRLRYGDESFFDNSEDVENMKHTADYHLRNAYMFDYDDEKTNFSEVNDLIKQFVYRGLAVDVAFYSNTAECYDDEYFSINSNKRPKDADHSVAIVGWDDDFPAENFKIKPENDGAWLIKNSWGDDTGDGGFMWISYENSSLCEFAVYELEDSDEYMYNYSHDSFVPLQSLSAYDDSEINEPSYMANIFTPDTDTQIEAVSVYINNPMTEYEITVYKNLTDLTNPSSGIPSSVTKGTQELTGFFTFELADDVIVEQGESFSVVMKMYCPDSPYVVPLETCIAVEDETTKEILSLGSFTSYEGIKEYTHAGESFYSTDNADWHDTYYEEFVYTEDEEEEILVELEEEFFDGIDPDDTVSMENAAAALELYREIFASGKTFISIGNISMKALGNPVGTVDFSTDSGIVPDGRTVALSTKNNADIYYSVNGGEYELYTQPIEIKGLTNISAMTENNTPAERSFIPYSEIPVYGDTNADGFVDAIDASNVLEHYSSLSTDGAGTLYKAVLEYADFNQDGFIDAKDASGILALYAELSTQVNT